jgi:hypothetical protein
MNAMNTWTPEEESAFAQLIHDGHLERMSAIRLLRRCRCNLAKALAIAGLNAAPRAAARRTNAARREAIKCHAMAESG